MPQIPVFNQQTTAENLTPLPAKSASVSVEAFNPNSGLDDLGRGMIYSSKALDEIQEERDKVSVLENANAFDAAAMNILHNPENGFFTKTGKNAVDSMQSTIDDLLKNKEEIYNSLKNNRQKTMAASVFDSKIQNIQERMMQYGAAQNQVWKKDTLASTIDTQTQQAVTNKYDTKAIYTNIGNIRKGIEELSGEGDPQLLKKMQDEATSNVHISVIEGRVGDKALNAKDYYEAHKNEIDATKHDELLKLINSNDSDVRSRLMADEWLNSGMSEEEAYNKAHKIKDLDLRDAVESQVNNVYEKKRKLEEQTYRDKKDQFWNTFADNPDLNNIPAWMDGNDRITARNYALSGGKAKPDADAYISLYEMSATNAEAFSKIDLNQYRDKLTKDEFKTFSTRQQNVRMHGYSTVTPDDDAVLDVIDSFGGWNKPKEEVVASQIQNIINEEERRTGQKYSAVELKAAQERVAGWLNYSKEGSSTKVLSENEAKAGFYKGLSNDITYFQKVHNRQPDQKEFQSILYQRAAKMVQAKNSAAYKTALNNTVAKPHETKAVTYYADNYIPQLGKELGVKLSIVAGGRYNPKAKGYDSKHNVNGVSQAVDISMSEHSASSREKIFKSQLDNPLVKKIGTSDKNLLAKYGNNPKVEDETHFDSTHGTNHINHMHVSLNVDSQSSDRIIIADKNGKKYTVPQYQLAEAIKQGYRRI